MMTNSNASTGATKRQAPGQVGELIAPKQGEGWVFLSWKEASDGGKITAYEVQRRQRPTGKWLDVATALGEETTLVEQPRGPELEYRICAVNKTGRSQPSNTALVVL